MSARALRTHDDRAGDDRPGRGQPTSPTSTTPGLTGLLQQGQPLQQVQKSVYSKLAGVPVALMGLIGYVLILGSLLAPESEGTRFATVGSDRSAASASAPT